MICRTCWRRISIWRKYDDGGLGDIGANDRGILEGCNVGKNELGDDSGANDRGVLEG